MFVHLLLGLLTLITTPIHAQDATSSATTITPFSSPEPTAQAAVPTSFPLPTDHPSLSLFNQYKKDYLFLRDNYQRDYLTYIDKSRVYTKYGTVTTQKDKLDAAKVALTSRNKMFKGYLMALRTELDLYQSSAPTETEANKIDLSKQEAYFEEQNQIISSINNVTDMDKWAIEFRTKYINIQSLIYSTLVRIEVNTKIEAQNQIKILANAIQPKTSNQSWVNSLAVKNDLAVASLNNALEITRIKQNQNRFNNFYPDSQKELAKAQNYLSDISNDLKIIVIKYYQP
ncbi:hypothetical protein KBC75_03155 [Candidatus Shapirobacteria bacterium]|nr:hypothetical protein [Candidatus Shapirobacteria bacterium]